MEITVTAADGTRLTARRTGRGVPVVLVHGSAGGLDSWDPVAPFLSDRCELWVYARRGYPPSGDSGGRKTFADEVGDLRAVLAAAGGSAHVVGASYGATVGLHAASASGTAIRSLTLFEPPLFAAGSTMTTTLERFRDLVDAGDVASATRLFAQEVARVPAAILDALGDAVADPGDAAEQAVAAAEAIGCLHDLEAMTADTVDIRRWASIDLPVLLLQGSDTWAPLPDTMAALAEAMPSAARVVLAGQSHFATHTAPEMFAEAVRRFLNENDRP